MMFKRACELSIVSRCVGGENFPYLHTDMTRIRSLLGDELADAVDEDWQSRVEAMEAALDRPGSIELSSDLRRAELRYEQDRVLTLQQTPRGWRITALE